MGIQEYSDSEIYLLIFIFLLIIVIILGVSLAIARPWVKDDILLNEECDSSKKCVKGTTCQNGVCKSNPGSYCNDIRDCTSVSVGCINGFCHTKEMKL